MIGIEAEFELFEIVRDNLVINGFIGFGSAIHAAASDSESEMTLYRRNTRSGNTSIISFGEDYARAMGEPASEAFIVKGLRIDSLLDSMQGRVDFMKVDVEGCEPLAVAGARETIARNPGLKIAMEWSPGQIQLAGFDLGDFLKSLKAQGLEVFDIPVSGVVERMSFDELLNAPYRAGVLLTKAGS